MGTSDNLKNWMQGRKDSSVSFVLQKVLQKWIEPYGVLEEFKIDSRQGSASVQIRLKGEPEPVTLQVQEYQLLSNESGQFITLHRASASREWLNLALRDFVLGRPFPIPEAYAGYAKMIL